MLQKLKRWRLVAHPLEGDLEPGLRELSDGLAQSFNGDPQRFVLRASARSAAKFYESRIYLPVTFTVVREVAS